MVSIKVNGVEAEMNLQEFKEFISGTSVNEETTTEETQRTRISPRLYKKHRKQRAFRSNLLWSKQDNAELERQYMAGNSVKSIARMLGRTRQAISWRAHVVLKLSRKRVGSKHSRHTHRTHTFWTLAQAQEMIKLKNQGMSPREISNVLGKTENAIVARIFLIKKYGLRTNYTLNASGGLKNGNANR